MSARHGSRQVLHDVSLAVGEGEFVALVGGSGSGKTTLSRCIAGLHTPSAGRVEITGEQLAGNARQRSTHQRQSIQYIFQNPYNALNPRKTIEQIVAAPLRHLRGLGRAETQDLVRQALQSVSLPWTVAGRRPAHLSGGERQRVAIARALVCEPRLLVCDEITSALDVSVQAAILELLAELRSKSSLSILFVTHDLGVVRTVADRIVVMKDGRLVEEGPTDTVLDQPATSFVRDFVRDTPRLPFMGDPVSHPLSGQAQ